MEESRRMKGEAPILSVIVPFYNSEKTLLRCLKSIEAQTLKGIELILIDDGSEDESLSIANQFAASYVGKCKVLHQVNSGPSAARNYGLDVSEGTFVAFADSDDTVDSTMYEKMVESAEKFGSDIVSCGKIYLDVKSGGEIRRRIPKYDVLQGNVRTNPSIVKRVGPLMCDKIFRRSVIEGHSLRMNPDLSHAEDFLFISECKLYTRCVSAVKEPLYRYYIGGSDSISSGNERILDIPKACQSVIDLYIREKVFDSARSQLLYVLLGYYLRKCDSVDPRSPIILQFKSDFRAIFDQYFSDIWIKGMERRISRDYDVKHACTVRRRAMPLGAQIRYLPKGIAKAIIKRRLLES